MAGLLASKWSGAIGGDIVAVRVYPSRIIGPRYLRRLGRRALDGVSIPKSPFDGFRIDDTQLGNGYGHETEAGLEAQALFAQDGIWLDTTYTAKAAAALMQYARHEGHGKRLLFWYTGSEAHQPSTDLAVEIPGAFRALMR